MINPEKIKVHLQQVQEQNMKYRPTMPGVGMNTKQPAAVLIPIFQDDGVWKMLFIKRTHHHEDHHSGQIAFPGGRFDRQDSSLLDTALRETEEEIGVQPDDVDILGQSSPITTVTDYEITPYLGVIPWPYPLELSEIEVEKTIIFPFTWLADPKNRRVKSWKSRSIPPKEIPVIFFNEYQGEILWGATAQIVMDLLELIKIL
jgi:8-oxo-dGTP pyrophosphatase MutT (NUDIX family)